MSNAFSRSNRDYKRTCRAIATNLSRLRARHGLTHREVGAQVGRTMFSSMRWCRARSTPSMRDLQSLSKLYGVSVARLIRAG